MLHNDPTQVYLLGTFPSSSVSAWPFSFKNHQQTTCSPCRFIKWTEQTFTAGGRETELLPLLERCTRELQELPRYKDDARYLRIWVKYADCCKEPQDIFKFLQANDIGQRHTLFYEAYAAFLEIRGAFSQANEVYDRGIMMRAQPRDRLKDKLAQFQHRMMKRKRRKLEEGGGTIEDEGNDEPSRRFGEQGASGSARGADAENGGAVRGGGGGATGISGTAVTGGFGLKRGRGYRAASAGASASTSSENANGGGLEVYCDDDNGGAPAVAAPAPWRNLGKYQETRKENTQSASQWVGQTLKQKRTRPGAAGAPPPAETLEVYEDEDLAQADAEAKATAAANAAAAMKSNANALRRRLDAADTGGALSSGLASNPMLYHGKGAPAPQTCPGERPATLYGCFNAGDMTDSAGRDVTYEERRAQRWEAIHGPVTAPPPTSASIVGREIQEEQTQDQAVEQADQEEEMEMEMEECTIALPTGMAVGGAFATVTATTVLATVPEAAEEMSPEPQSAPPPPVDPSVSVQSCETPAADEGSGVPGRVVDPTDEAQGVPVEPTAVPVPPPAAVPAGLRWTATEGGTYGMQDPTMTICTKEAWGDIMSMFSGGLASEGEAEEKRARKAASGTAKAVAIGLSASALSPVTEMAIPREPAEVQRAEEGRKEYGFEIYEDTCLLPPNATTVAAAGDTVPLPSPTADIGGGLEIREDTVLIPPQATTALRTPAPPASAARLAARTPLGAVMVARTPLAPTTAPGAWNTPASARVPLASRQAAAAAMPPPPPVVMTPAAPADENDVPVPTSTAADVNVTAGEDSFAVYEDETAEIFPSAAASAAVSLDQPTAPASTPVPSDGGLEIYQDTVLLDPAAVAVLTEGATTAPAPISPQGLDYATRPILSQGEGSHGNAPTGSAQPTRTFGEPSETSPEEQEAAHPPELEVYEDDGENAAPANVFQDPALANFVPRSITEAAAAAAALRPLTESRAAELDVRMMTADETSSEGDGMDPAPGTLAYAENALRTAKPPVELQGEDDFEVYADEEMDTAPIPQVVTDGRFGHVTRLSPIMSEPEENTTSVSSLAGIAPPASTPMAPSSTGHMTPRAVGLDDVTAPVPAPAAAVITINPFDVATLDSQLAAVESQLASWQGVFVHAGEETLSNLRAAVKSGGGARQRARSGTKLNLGDSEFVLMGLAGSGAHAKVYEAEYAEIAAAEEDEDDDFGDEDDHDKLGGLAIKVQSARLAKWEWVVCKRLAERLDDASTAGVLQPKELHLLGGSTSFDSNTGVVVMPFGEHGTLQDVVNSYLRVGASMDELLVMYYTIELLRLTKLVHGAGMLHTDIKPDNLLVRNGGDDWCDWAAHRPGSWKEKGLTLIDLGRAIDLMAFPEGAKFVGDSYTEGFRCSEMIEGKPWTYEADMHCVAATVHTLLFGKYMEVQKVAGSEGVSRYRLREPLKRYWQADLWETFFDSLLNSNDSCPLNSLRRMFEEHIASKGLGQKLRVALMKQTINMYQQIREGKA